MYNNKLMRKKKTTREKWQKITRPTFTRTLQGFERFDYTLDINGIQRNSIPTSDRILKKRLCKENFIYKSKCSTMVKRYRYRLQQR